MNASERFRRSWSAKTIAQVEKEIKSFRRYFEKHKDSFFQESAPESLSDGQQFNILRDILEEKKNGQKTGV